jgi:hypothetical protein
MIRSPGLSSSRYGAITYLDEALPLPTSGHVHDGTEPTETACQRVIRPPRPKPLLPGPNPLNPLVPGMPPSRFASSAD